MPAFGGEGMTQDQNTAHAGHPRTRDAGARLLQNWVDSL